MKAMFLISIAGLVFGATATSLLAQASGVAEVGWEKYGVTGLMGAVLMYLLVKFIPKMQDDFKQALSSLAASHEKTAEKVAADAKEAAVMVAKINADANSELCGKLDDLIESSKQTTSEIKASGDMQLNVLRQAVMERKKSGDV
jgi:hypothetical protein